MGSCRHVSAESDAPRPMSIYITTHWTASQIVQKELRYPVHQHFACGWIADAVPAPGKRHHLNVLAKLNQLINQRKRVSEVHVVVAGPMRNEQLSLQARSPLDWRGRSITLFILRQQPQVPLRVDRIVEVPIRDRPARETCLEGRRCFKHGVK